MLLGAGLTVQDDAVMVGANDAKFGEKRRSGKLVVGDNKGEEVGGRERRGGGGLTREGRGGWGFAIDANLYQRDVL